jgi:hypothetical protein
MLYMKIFKKISILISIILCFYNISIKAQDTAFVKKDTTMTFSIDPASGSLVDVYDWKVEPPEGATLPPGTTNSKDISWIGDTGFYKLSVTPTSNLGCVGEPKDLIVKIYSSITELLIKVTWGPDPSPLCSPGSGSATTASIVNVTGYTGMYTISYRVDNGDTTNVTLNTFGTNAVTINSGLNNLSNSVDAIHNVKIVKIKAGSVTQTYSDAEAPRLRVVIKAVPGITDIQYIH